MRNAPFASSARYCHTSPYWVASQSASLVTRHGSPSKRATSSCVELPTWILSACSVFGSCASVVHSHVSKPPVFAAVCVCCATENAASPTTLSAINGILVLIFRNSALSLLRIIVVQKRDPCQVQ